MIQPNSVEYFRLAYNQSNDPTFANEILTRAITDRYLTLEQAKYISKGTYNPPVKAKTVIGTSNMIKIKGIKSLPPKKYLCKKLELEAGSLAILCASGSSGKTMFSQYLAVCVSSGTPLFKTFPVTQGKVIHIDQEQSALQTQRRYERIVGGIEVDELDICRIELAYRLDDPNLNLQETEEELTNLFVGASLVIIDSLKASTIVDENSSAIEVLLKMYKRIAEKTQTTIVLIHHKGKSKSEAKQTGRGHSSIYDSVDIQIDLDHEIKSDDYDLTCAKNRDGKPFCAFSYTLKDGGEFIPEQNCSETLLFSVSDVQKPALSDPKMIILQALAPLEQGLNQTQVYAFIKGDRGNFNKILSDLVKKLQVSTKTGAHNATIYTITDAGRSTIAYANKKQKISQ